MKHSFNKQQGYTLIELIIYIGLTALMLVSITAYVGFLLQVRVQNTTASEVEQQGIYAMRTITQVLRNAQTISTPSTGLSSASASATVIDAAKSPTVFTLSSGTLQIKEGAAAAVPITTSRVTVSNLSFTNLSVATASASLKIQYTVSFTNTSGDAKLNYSKTFYGTATTRK